MAEKIATPIADLAYAGGVAFTETFSPESRRDSGLQITERKHPMRRLAFTFVIALTLLFTCFSFSEKASAATRANASASCVDNHFKELNTVTIYGNRSGRYIGTITIEADNCQIFEFAHLYAGDIGPYDVNAAWIEENSSTIRTSNDAGDLANASGYLDSDIMTGTGYTACGYIIEYTDSTKTKLIDEGAACAFVGGYV